MDKVLQERKQELVKTYICTDSWISKKEPSLILKHLQYLQFIQRVTQTAVRN